MTTELSKHEHKCEVHRSGLLSNETINEAAIGIWQKKVKVSYILSIFVMMNHFDPTQNFMVQNEVIRNLNMNLNLLTRSVIVMYATPMFFVMSVFFFRNFTTENI